MRTFEELKNMSCRDIDDPEKLDDDVVSEYLDHLDNWGENDGVLVFENEFGSFQNAIEFIDDVARIADEEDHHPKIIVDYKDVRLELSTHSEGGITEKDIILAAKIDEF